MTRSTPAKTSIAMGVLTFLGVLATIVFQIVSARSLADRDFALFSTFLSIVNIAAIGSGALQNAVAVNMANSQNVDFAVSPIRPLKNSTFIEAIWLGGIGALVVLGFFTFTQTGLREVPALVVLAAVTVPLSFIFAQQVGLIQGAGNPVATLGWSTISTYIRLALAGLFLFIIPSALFALVNSVVVALGLTVLGTWWLSTRNLTKPSPSPFSKTTLVVVSNMLLFAWLTNFDVVVISDLQDSRAAANYALCSMIIKTSLIIPGTLSIIFLPRFAKSGSGNLRKERLFTEVLSLLGIGCLALFLWFWGSTVIGAVFGASYQVENSYVSLFAITFAPWVYAQALIIRSNSINNWKAPLILFFGVTIQIVCLNLVLPDTTMLMAVNGLVGFLVALLLKMSTKP